MKIVKENIGIDELTEMSSKMFGNLVKAVVDVEKKILVVDAELHSDQESYLLQLGSKQENLWGNNSRGVEDTETQIKILDIVNSKIIE